MPSYAEKKILSYRPDQLFDMVADVAKYPDFLPWCIGARVRSNDGHVMIADMVIGFKVFREKFTSRVVMQNPDRIDVKYLDGPFNYLENHWIFEPHPDGCRIDFHVDFEFRSKILDKAIGAVFGEAVRRMVSAFETRAHTLYDRYVPISP
ncbi:type II toxin-antitoxin system RatA family toxin [Varunaivibrio sulfuroxidans]|uniref:Coenzyme Q-binding protein COQ10 n=1 Tax=Varunaivibrio sulfuroxidans TaxID=1773489 RepID=A0A4R3JFE6_9PROT|nr:type II toxin-antitoxin system RatA family toxin [Varunaivibrio sulfuroxidans]TCS64205.1 coenzyme Q-binding protein COQ10 [Varunaivibrio sulfuroxidans]WES31351.1 type II toxin-antitoxin system RatA family toxin [Varunaivibrio sulfuroxidans]